MRMEVKSRLFAALAAATVVAAACGGAAATPAATSAPAATTAPAATDAAATEAPAVVDWATATSAGPGGVDAVCAAGKEEGTLNTIALPPDWADYGKMMEDFTAKYGIKIANDQPDVDSQQEINTAKQLAGTGRQPDTFDLAPVVAQANLDMFAPYQPVTWADIPDANKDAAGTWINSYTGYISIGYDASLGDIQNLADLADPKYKGKIAMNGDPTKASAGFNSVVLAALANGGSADDIQPGIDFWKKLAESGNFIPIDPAPTTIASGQTPIVLDWTYNNASQINPMSEQGVDWKVTVPADAPPVSSFYMATINKDAPHPAAARCWVEYLFSDAGQNTWLGGFATPIRLPAMMAAGTADKEALAAINPPTTAPVQLTAEQVDAAKVLLTDPTNGWNFITIQ
jgi:putative spermidine/putrescine transport system substrate-binding protein